MMDTLVLWVMVMKNMIGYFFLQKQKEQVNFGYSIVVFGYGDCLGAGLLGEVL